MVQSAHNPAEDSIMYKAVSREIEVNVTPRFLPDRSSPDNSYYFWAYTVTLTNLGHETVQLKTRHWRITDALPRQRPRPFTGWYSWLKVPTIRPKIQSCIKQFRGKSRSR